MSCGTVMRRRGVMMTLMMMVRGRGMRCLPALLDSVAQA